MSELVTTSVTINGHPCRVWKKGLGPKVGFFAGFGGLPKWIPFLDELAKTREVIVPSIPGFPGATSHPLLDTHLDWVLATRDLIRAAGLEGTDLIASSIGAGLVADVAAIWPESVRRLALIAPFGVFDSQARHAKPGAQQPDMIPSLVSAKPELYVKLTTTPAEDVNPADWAIEQRHAAEASMRLFLHGDQGLAKRLHRVTAPTLLVWGSDDKVLPLGHADFFASGIRVGEVRILRGAGHLAELDDPHQTAMAVLSWIDHADRTVAMTTKQDRKTVGIIGYGQMGQFAAKLLAPAANVRAWDPRPQAGLTPLDEVAASDVVFLFPPIDQMGPCCEAIRELVRPGAIVVEGCSVMSAPVAAMRRTLPASVDLVGCHPLFGPQSGANGVAGLKLVLSPVRTSRLEEIANLWNGLGLKIVVMTPEEHDRAMARTQALEQIIGRILIMLDVDDEEIDVPGYKKLVALKRLLEADDDALFRNIQIYNPFARDIASRVSSALSATLALADVARRNA